MKASTFSKNHEQFNALTVYTSVMKWITLPESTVKIKSKYVVYQALVLAAIYIILTVVQLFHFEKVPEIYAAYGLPGEVIASLIVVIQVAALPFLLMLKTSPLMRYVSTVAAILVPVWWWLWGIWLTFNNGYLTGIFGSIVEAPVGLLYVWSTTFLLVGAIVVVRSVFVAKPRLQTKKTSSEKSAAV